MIDNVIQLRPDQSKTRTTLKAALDDLAGCQDLVLIGRNRDGTFVRRSTCDGWQETITLMAQAIEDLAS